MQIVHSRLISYIYLILVPIVAAALGFGVGHVSPIIYLPVWILNVAFMIFASWSLGPGTAKQQSPKDYNLAIAAFFLIIPFMLISMFAGLGPPPETATEWTNTATEQQVRYFFLVISGVFVAFGFHGVADSIRTVSETLYTRISTTAISIAIPLFIANMLFWGFYLTSLFGMLSGQADTGYPDWFLPVKQLFGVVSVVEVALTYLATFAIVVALKKAGWLKKIPSGIYMGISAIAFTIITLSAFFTEALRIPGFAVSIPAFPFLMPYFLGVNILRKLGNRSQSPAIH